MIAAGLPIGTSQSQVGNLSTAAENRISSSSSSLSRSAQLDAYCPLSVALSSLPLDLISPKTRAHARRHGIFSAAQLMLLSTNQLKEQLRISEAELRQGGGWRERLIAYCWSGVINCSSVGQRRPRRRLRLVDSCKHNEESAAHYVSGRENQPTDTSPKIWSQSSTSFTLGDAMLDCTIGGALRPGMITEIAGESSTGKSQLAMQLIVYTALGWTPSGEHENNPGATVALLVSEGDAQATIFVRRMLQIAGELVRQKWKARPDLYYHSRRQPTHHDIQQEAEPRQDGDVRQQPLPTLPESLTLKDALHKTRAKLLRNVYISPIRDLEALEHALTYTLPGLARRLLDAQGSPPLRLVVMDSLAPLFYVDQPGSSFGALMLRTRWSNLIADELKKLARFGMICRAFSEQLDRESSSTIDGSLPSSIKTQGGTAVVVLNHVSDVFDRDLGDVYQILRRQQVSKVTGGQAMDVTAERAKRDLEPPLSYSAQSPFFTGLLASVKIPAVGKHESRPDATEEQLHFAPHLSKQAALGHVWNNCINARIFLCKHDVSNGGDSKADADKFKDQVKIDSFEKFAHDDRRSKLRRTLHLIFSPSAPSRSAPYVISKMGLRSAVDPDSSALAETHELRHEKKLIGSSSPSHKRRRETT